MTRRKLIAIVIVDYAAWMGLGIIIGLLIAH